MPPRNDGFQQPPRAQRRGGWRAGPLSGGQRGFTLIETIVVIVLLSLMGTFSVQYIREAAYANRLVGGQKDLVDNAKLAMEYLIREMRIADLSTNDIRCTASLIACVTGTDYSYVVFNKAEAYAQDTNKSTITYQLTSTNLTRTSSSTTTTVAQQVSSFAFRKMSTDFYRITLTMSGSDGQSFTLVSAVRVNRSLRT